MYGFRSVLLACCLIFLSPAAHTQTIDRQSVMQACMGDYRAHCFGVMPGEGRILQCLSTQIDQLAPTCRELVVAGTNCLSDAQRLCNGIEPGDGRIMACLRDNLPNVSAECGKAISTYAPTTPKG